MMKVIEEYGNRFINGPASAQIIGRYFNAAFATSVNEGSVVNPIATNTMISKTITNRSFIVRLMIIPTINPKTSGIAIGRIHANSGGIMLNNIN